jgi:hypothetical protein
MKKLILTGLAASLALAMACGGDKTSNPVSPSSTEAGGSTAAGPDGATLKVTAPVQVSPANGATLENFSAPLTIQKSTASFVTSEAYAYRFQLLNGSTVIAENRTSALSWAPSGLTSKTTYGWRARAEQGGFFGPWSATWTFTTPDKPEGFNRPGELYDPLTNGTTIGRTVGNVTFIDGVGAKLEGLTSYIQYRLPETITGGEISVLVTNLAYNTEGGKTKIMAMSEDLADITTNDRRFTIEKRGDPPGTVAWRVITSNDQIDTIGSERVQRNFDTSHTYLWKATWGSGRFNLTIKDGGVNGNTIYNFGKGYRGVYDPNPHMVFIGGPGGRAGANSGSVPDIIVRQLWVGRGPRPAYANQ